MQLSGLQKSLQVLLLLFLGMAALFFAKSFLVPVILAGLFAMLFLPLNRKLEGWGLSRGMAVLSCVSLLMSIIAAIVFLVSWPISNIVQDLGSIEDKLQTLWDQLQEYISQTFGISPAKQQEAMDQQTENNANRLTQFIETLFAIMVDFVLMMVYIFLFMFYRTRIKNFILKLVPTAEKSNTEDAIENIKKISQQYMTGLGMMIVCLWIMYSIGFSLLGLKHAVFFAIICGLFEIVPFVGNLAGNTLAVLMAVTQGGGTPMVIGIVIVYGLIQFFQTYVLEPLVVGSEVNLNPMFTIIGLVIGELVWGIPGLILAIPLLGIIKIICDHIPNLQPYGYILGRERKNKNSWVEKLKKRFG